MFSFAPVNSTYTAIYNFKGGADGAFPEAGLIAAHGALYGSTTGFNGNGNGTVFAIDPSSGAETRLYRFTGGYDGAAPAGCLLSAAGLLVGVAQGGGFSNNGVAFTIDAAAKTETVLYNFAGTENSYGGPLLAAAGTLYGTATGAGTFGYGAIIQVNPKTGAGTVLYSFKGGPDGYFPAGALANLSGTLYGATAKGGTTNQGTLFKLDPNGTKTTLYNFVGGTDGALPESGLTLAGVTLYGATYSGGTSGSGTLYSLDPTTGSKTTLYNFTGGSDGALPWAPLTYSNRTLYGTTLNGGIKHRGAVFALNPVTNTETTLYDFKGGADSSTPFGGVISVNRLLFGTTSNIGSPGPAGTIYSLDPSTDTETVLFGFASGPTGTSPLAGLLASGGKLYGTAAFGGASGNGTLFAFDPVTNTETTLHTFSAGTDSGVPQAPLTKSGPALYGTTTALDGNPGIVFKLRP